MPTARVGSNKQYAEGWDKIFGGGKKKSPKKKATKKAAPKKAAKKKATKKKPAKKSR